MKQSYLAICAMLLVACSAISADKKTENEPKLPEGYKLLYEQDFEKEGAIKDFEFTDKTQWKIVKKDGKAMLSFGNKANYKPKVRSPRIIGLISNRVFGDFIMQARVQQNGREYNHRDMCFFFGFTDKSKFYYSHVASKADNNAHNILIVKDAPRIKIGTKVTGGVKWGAIDSWHTVRIVRKGSDGTIKVYFDDMTSPVHEAKDESFKTGYIGFGSFDDTGMIDRIRIWGSEVTEKKSEFFEKKE